MEILNRWFNLGIVSCLLFIISQLGALVMEYMGFDSQIFKILFSVSASVFSFFMLFVLWLIIVKKQGQSNLDAIFKILLSILALFSCLLVWHMLVFNRVLAIVVTLLSVINVIAYFVFIYQVGELEKMELKHMNWLKNYGVAFCLCFLGQLILNVVMGFNSQSHLSILSYVFNVIPVFFVVAYFVLSRKENRQLA